MKILILLFAVFMATSCFAAEDKAPLKPWEMEYKKPQEKPDLPIVKATAYCVTEVHNTKTGSEWEQEVYNQHFDAFYNPSIGAVESNAYRAGDKNSLFVFNKCMAKQGFPLTYK